MVDLIVLHSRIESHSPSYMLYHTERTRLRIAIFKEVHQ